MLLIASLFWGIYLFPAFLLIIVPNKIGWFINALLLLCCLYGMFLGQIITPKGFGLFCFVMLPAIIFKSLAILFEKRGLSGSKLAPFFGLIGPIILLSNFQGFESFFREDPIPAICLDATLQPEIAGYVFHISPAKDFEIEQNVASVSFRTTELGSLCKKTANGSIPFHAVSFGLPAYPELKQFCSSQDASAKELCARLPERTRTESYSGKIRIYEREHGADLIIGGLAQFGYDSTYSHYLEEKAESGSKEVVTPSYPLGMVSITGLRGSEDIWITNDPNWKMPDGAPYATSCSGAPGGSVCTTAYPINDKLALRYSFSSRYDELPIVARIADFQVQKIISGWH